MIDPVQFRATVVRPALRLIGHWSEAAENLVWGTAVQESRLRWLRQLEGGPALGLFQMEPATHDDIWTNYLAYRSALAGEVGRLLAPAPSRLDQLATNLLYGAALARVHYLRAPQALPAAGDIDGLAAYWKRFYNTGLGAGTADEFAANYRRVDERSA